MGGQGGARRAVWGWALYDLGNVIFFMTILSLYFPLWVVDKGGSDADYGIANSLSMALVLVVAPLLGAASDRVRRRMPFLLGATLLCCACTALLGLGGLFTSLAVFVAANFFFQAGGIFYDILLPSVSTPEQWGTVGGLAIGLSYVGTLLAVAVGLTVLHFNPSGKPLIFRLTAVLFALFALPCFFWVREPRQTPTPASRERRARPWDDVRQMVARARATPDLGRFLVGRVFYSDAATTMLAFMSIYVTKQVGFSETGAQIVLVAGILGGLVGAFLWGPAVDRVGPKRTLNRVLALWVALFSAVVAIAYLHLPGALFWLVAPLAGVALSGLSVADRPYMLHLTPPRHLGQLYVLYAMVGRFAAVLGPLLWAVIVDALGWGRPAAIVSLLVMVVISLVVLRPVRDATGRWAADDALGAEPARQPT